MWIRARGYIGIRCAVALVAIGLGLAGPAPAHAQDATTLRGKHGILGPRLAKNEFLRPLVVESTQAGDEMEGSVYAVVDQPFAVVAPALRGKERWCELLILHLNVKLCSTSGAPPSEVLSLFVGSKHDEELEDTYRVDFAFVEAIVGNDYLNVQMTAKAGPFRTRDYRLALEAVGLDEKRSFVHLSYSYAYGIAARVAMKTYLGTVGRKKVGFSILGKTAEGKPIYVGGIRGVVERNAMRYYLAIESHLGAFSATPGERIRKPLRDWFAAVERYPLQLHELERSEYLEMKMREVSRQRAAARASRPD